MRLFLSLIAAGFLSISSIAAQDGVTHNSRQDRDEAGRGAEGAALQGDAGICPVLGNKAVKKYSYAYEGKTYYFCCPGCIEAFKKNPDKYISKIKEFKLEAYRFGFKPDEIVVARGDSVSITASSRDVTHGVYIRDYGINLPVKKGEEKKIEFIADKAGEFPIICSVYCGPGHRNMRAKLIVKE